MCSYFPLFLEAIWSGCTIQAWCPRSRKEIIEKFMLYTPEYRYIPPFNRDWLTPWYDASCPCIGLGRRFKEKVLNFITLAPGGTVADIGCGTGVLLEAIK